jgi:hypothetical protein
MVSERTLNIIRDAFIRLSIRTDLRGWQLDPMGWNYNGNQETEDTDIHLLRGESERASLTILPEPGASVESLEAQIQQLMIGGGLIG